MTARITVVDSVYWSTEDGQPVQISSRFSRPLESEEQPYIRRITVGEEWQPLDLGWVGKVGLLVLANEPTPRRVQPTAEERDEDDARVVLVVWDRNLPYAGICIPPREDCRLRPIMLAGQEKVSLWIRCLNGITKVTVNAIPA